MKQSVSIEDALDVLDDQFRDHDRLWETDLLASETDPDTVDFVLHCARARRREIVRAHLLDAFAELRGESGAGPEDTGARSSSAPRANDREA